MQQLHQCPQEMKWMLLAERQETHAHRQAPHIVVEPIAATQLLPANCFILSGSPLQHKELLQGMAGGTLPRHSENSLYWQRGEQGEWVRRD